MSKDEMSFYKLKKKDSRYTKDETPQDEVGRHPNTAIYYFKKKTNASKSL